MMTIYDSAGERHHHTLLQAVTSYEAQVYQPQNHRKARPYLYLFRYDSVENTQQLKIRGDTHLPMKSL